MEKKYLNETVFRMNDLQGVPLTEIRIFDSFEKKKIVVSNEK